MKLKSNREKECPFCGGNNTLDYERIEMVENDVGYYKWHCLNCDNNGEEWVEINFLGHNVEIDNEMIEITDNMIGDEE